MNKKGFTLVEVLTVVVIIVLLSTIGFVLYRGFAAKARDNRRIADLNRIAQALEVYKKEKGYYPTDLDSYDTSVGNFTQMQRDGSNFLVGTSWALGGIFVLEQEKYIDKLPVDPINNNEFFYYYEPHCKILGLSNRHVAYTLEISKLETTGEKFEINGYYKGGGHESDFGGKSCVEYGCSLSEVVDGVNYCF